MLSIPLSLYFEASTLQFIFEYMQIVSNMRIAKNEHGREIENKFIQNVLRSIDFDSLLKLFEKEDFIKTPSIGLHYYRFKTIEDADNLNYYYLLKTLLFKNLTDLEREDRWFFHVHLANYCVQKNAVNAEGFGKEIITDL